MKWLLDEMLPRALAEPLNEAEHDAVSVYDIGLAGNEPCVRVVFVRKSDFPRGGALAVHVARHLHNWAAAHPEPYIGPHWP